MRDEHRLGEWWSGYDPEGTVVLKPVRKRRPFVDFDLIYGIGLGIGGSLAAVFGWWVG